MRDLQISNEISRIEAVTTKLLDRRIMEFNFSLTNIVSCLTQNLAIAISIMFALFLILSLIFSYETIEALKISGITASIIFSVYTTVLFSRDEISLTTLTFKLGELSTWRKIVYLNSIIIQQETLLEQSRAITNTSVQAELIAQVKSYFSGSGFNPNTKAFSYLLKRNLASLDNNGIVILKAESMADLLAKLKTKR